MLWSPKSPEVTSLTRLPKTLANEPDSWQHGQRRMFQRLVWLLMLACLAALLNQSGNYDPLDRVALPAFSLVLLALQILVAVKRITLRAAFAGTFYGAATYLLLALSHQFQVLPARSQTLMENTYWFAVLYAAAFLTFNNRTALKVSGVILALSCFICVWHLNFTVLPEFKGKLIGSSMQFLLTGAVMTIMQATVGFQRAQLLATRSAAYTDALTGLSNRRAAEEHLASLAGANGGFTLVLFDLDHFKQVNDQHGHATGDLVLRNVADTARKHVPRGGMVARWGGEEFLIVLPATMEEPMPPKAVRRLLNDLRDDLRQQQHGAVKGVTACFGVAVAGANEHPDRVLARADTAMYAAKGQGRNAIRTADAGRTTRVTVAGTS